MAVKLINTHIQHTINEEMKLKMNKPDIQITQSWAIDQNDCWTWIFYNIRWVFPTLNFSFSLFFFFLKSAYRHWNNLNYISGQLKIGTKTKREKENGNSVFLLIILSVERFDLYSMSTYFIQRFLIARGFISSVFL